jgi:hypothetical protein
MGALRGRSFGIGKLPLPARTTSYGHLLWALGAAVLSMAVGGIVKSCGFSGHAATFSSLPSTSSPLWNFAPALTNATR